MEGKTPMPKLLPILAGPLLLACLSSQGVAENWPQFRGPNADGGVDYFYLDYRQPVGWDAGLGQKAFEGILVHLGNDTTADSSRLLDMDFADSWREALLPGMSFHDRASDVTISLLSADSAEAIMEITVGDDITPPTTSIGTEVLWPSIWNPAEYSAS